MLSLKQALNSIYSQLTGRYLAYLSMGRFNQQVTTKFHLDGAPDEAYLMLGYEPTEVQSSISIADCTRAAYEWGIEPKTLLSDFNPMDPRHESRLLPYVTRLESFDPSAAQVLLLNNSSLPYNLGQTNTLGVMHQATILTPMPGRPRVVNSTMIGPVADVCETGLGVEAQRTFVETLELAGEIKA
jgi:hypothetical protein